MTVFDQTNFSCSMCGKCCHDLRLPLTLAEARSWLEREGRVDVLSEAVPWPVEPDANNAPAMYKRKRTFAARSGDVPIRVGITLAASYKGACPNLGDDNRCRNYDDRPRVCRIYPANINPFSILDPASGACPQEAWQAPQPFAFAGVPLDTETRRIIDEMVEAGERELHNRRTVCERLGVSRAALSHEGFVVYSPSPAAMLEALSGVCALNGHENPDRQWTLVSANQQTTTTLKEIGCRFEEHTNMPDGYGYESIAPK